MPRGWGRACSAFAPPPDLPPLCLFRTKCCGSLTPALGLGPARYLLSRGGGAFTLPLALCFSSGHQEPQAPASPLGLLCCIILMDKGCVGLACPFSPGTARDSWGGLARDWTRGLLHVEGGGALLQSPGAGGHRRSTCLPASLLRSCLSISGLCQRTHTSVGRPPPGVSFPSSFRGSWDLVEGARVNVEGSWCRPPLLSSSSSGELSGPRSPAVGKSRAREAVA